jgi:threonine synthase
MPAGGFLAACNANTVVPDFLETAIYRPRPSIATLSNAMDVGNPSNFVRILEIFNNEFPTLKENLSAASVTDEETIATMLKVYDETGYTLDPHGAVGYKALADHLMDRPGQKGIVLETAHPVKFDSVSEILEVSVETPPSVLDLLNKEKVATEIEADQETVKEVILSRI